MGAVNCVFSIGVIWGTVHGYATGGRIDTTGGTHKSIHNNYAVINTAERSGFTQDQVNEKSAALSIKAGKLTGRVLAKAFAAVLRRMRNPKEKHGRQSVQSLARRGGGLQDIEVTDDNIKSFERTARKYHVDYALKYSPQFARDTDPSHPGRWRVFFRARDADALTAAFKEFSAKTLGRQKQHKPSLLERVAHFKKAAKATPAKVKNLEHGGPEH
mgnify:FL=1